MSPLLGQESAGDACSSFGKWQVTRTSSRADALLACVAGQKKIRGLLATDLGTSTRLCILDFPRLCIPLFRADDGGGDDDEDEDEDEDDDDDDD